MKFMKILCHENLELYGIDVDFFLRAAELNEEATRCLQEFPKEMIFHLSSLHLLESVGQGTKKCENLCCILTIFKFMLE